MDIIDYYLMPVPEEACSLCITKPGIEGFFILGVLVIKQVHKSINVFYQLLYTISIFIALFILLFPAVSMG